MHVECSGREIYVPPFVPAGSRPIVTLTTDFGTRDHYVAAMKAALLRATAATADVRMIDVTHEVPRHDILCGAITLERAVDGFPPGTIHLAVIDPGVGTPRRILVARINDQTIVCPDNGLITWAWRRMGPGAAHELTARPDRDGRGRGRGRGGGSSTFHGRDIMAPAAAMLVSGARIEEIARPIDDPILLDAAPASPEGAAARIIHLDVFGNATTNLDQAALRARADQHFRVHGRDIGPLRRTYCDVAPGKPLALIGSSGLLEIAVRDGSAQEQLNLEIGDEVTW